VRLALPLRLSALRAARRSADLSPRYSFDAPQIGDVAGKAWHSVLNGFQASLEPFLAGGGGGGGGACSRSGGRAREHSPERLSGGRRRASSLGSLRSASPGRSSSSGGDDDDDPFFTPNPTTRLTLKLPALRRQCLRSLSTSPTRSILRRCAANVSLDAACRSPTSPSAAALALLGDDPSAPFPPLSPASSAPPPIASTHADDPAALSALVPLAPCCASCERATHYGLLPDGPGAGTACGATYRERWTAGAKKKRAEERREREAREKGEASAAAATATTADKLAAAVARRAAEKGGKDEREEEKEAEEAEEEARASRLGQLAAKGGVDELARERGRRGTPDAPAEVVEGDEDEPATPVEAREPEPRLDSPTTSAAAAVSDMPPRADAERLSTAVVPLAAPHRAASDERPQAASPAAASAPPRPPLDSTTSAPAALPTRTDAPTLPSLSRTSSPTTGSSVAAPPDSAPVRPTNKRRLSTATASLSRFAAAFGQGLLHNSSSAGDAGGAGVRA